MSKDGEEELDVLKKQYAKIPARTKQICDDPVKAVEFAAALPLAQGYRDRIAELRKKLGI